MGLSLKKLNAVWSGLDFWDKQENAQQRQNYAQQGNVNTYSGPYHPSQPQYNPAVQYRGNGPVMQAPPQQPIVHFGSTPTGQAMDLTQLNVNKVKPTVKPRANNKLVNAAKDVTEATIGGFRPVSQVIARTLPGGQNDIKAQNQAIDQTNVNRRAILNNDKLSWQQKGQLLHQLNSGHEISDAIHQTQQTNPDIKHAAASVADAAATVLSGGSYAGLKEGATVGGKVAIPKVVSKVVANKGAKVTARLAGNAAAGATNAYASGAHGKQLAENAVAGAAFPEVLRGGGKLLTKVPENKGPAPVAAKIPQTLSHFTTEENAKSIKQGGFRVSKGKSAQGDGVYFYNGDKNILGKTDVPGQVKLSGNLAPDTKLIDLNHPNYRGPSPTSGNKLRKYAESHGFHGATDGAQTVIYDTSKLDRTLTKPKLGMNANQNLDSIVNSHVDNSGENIKLRHPVVQGWSAAQEGVMHKPVDYVRDKVNEGLTKALTSDNRAISGVAGLPTTVFNRFGLKDSTRNIIRSRNGTHENAGRAFMHLSHDFNSRINNLKDPNASMDRLSRYFFDKDTVKALADNGHLTTDRKLPYHQLTRDEQKIADRLVHINKHTNNINFQLGKINEDQFKLGANGRHTPRIFDFKNRTKGANAGSSKLMDTGVSKQRKDISKFSEDTIAQMEKNPILAILARSETAIRDQATHDAMQALKKEGLVRKNVPGNNKNFSQLKGKKYGKFDGHWAYNPMRSEIEGVIHSNTDVGDALSKLITQYQGTKLGGLDRFFKSTKTTLSPGTFLGNILSNPIAFNSAAGVNSAQQSVNMAKAGARLIKDAHGNFDRGLYEARKHGVAANDTGRQLTTDRRQEFLGVDRGKTKNPAKVAGHVYGGVDQAAQLALFDELKRRGLDSATAARRVMNATQDYGGAGRAIQNLADAPVLGKPFARFTPELLRLVKNNVLYNPVGTALKGAAVVGGADALSHAAGETPEERHAREYATGQTVIPTSIIPGIHRDIPLNFATPKHTPLVGESAVNIARLSGLNYPIEPGGSAKGAIARQLDPTAISDILRQDAQGRTRVEPEKGVSSLTLRPIADQLANRDFMDRSITDPNNKTRIEGVGDKGKQYVSNLSKHDKTNNRIRSAGTGYVPFFNEGYTIKSAAQGKPDYYGKDRTKPQAALRSVGIKIESNNQDARQKRIDTQEYYGDQGKNELRNKFLRDHPGAKDAFAKIVSTTVDRKNNTRTNDTITPEKWAMVNAHPEIYDQLKKEAEYDNKHAKNANGTAKPIDPIFKLNDPQKVKELIRLNSAPTGDDQERKEILKATQPWYQSYSKESQDYYTQLDDWYNHLKPYGKGEPPNTNPRVQSYNNITYPDQPDIVKRYYQVKDGDAAQGKAFYKANADSLNNAFTNYKQQQLDFTNAKRKIEGAPPISKDVWNSVAFGYEDDAAAAKELASKGYGNGYGGYSRSSKEKVYNPDEVYNDPHKYDVSTKAKGSRQVHLKQPPTPVKAKARSKRAKVAMKVTKSKV